MRTMTITRVLVGLAVFTVAALAGQAQVRTARSV